MAAWFPFIFLLFFRDALLCVLREDRIKNLIILFVEFFVIMNLSFFAKGMGWTFFALLLISRKVARHYLLGIKE